MASILIVEDEQSVARDAESTLLQMGHSVIGCVDSGEKALVKAKESRPNLVLIDVRIRGEIDGISLAGILGERFNIPVIFLAAFADDETLARAKLTEPYGYLLKPFNAKELRTTVEIALYRYELQARMKDKEAELEATKIRLEHLLTANPAIIYTREVKGDSRITFISEDVKMQLGYEPKQLCASIAAWASKIHPEDRERVECAFLARGPEDHGTCEYRFMHANGTYRWLHDAYRFVPRAGGAPIEIIGCVIDITDRKDTEFLLAQQTRRLERSNRELEEFAYVASHDLRAPLRAIDTLSMWIQADLGENLKGETREQMDLLRGRVRRMDRLLCDLLDYARVGRAELATEVVNVHELISEVIDLSNASAKMQFQLPESLPTFETAKLPLKRVFLNLVNNAVKHHDRKEGRVVIDVEDNGDFYDFSITDDGPGIPPKFHDRIFQMFQTLKPRDLVEGSGMGLALVRRIVEVANGRVCVESVGERGSRFRFTWPKVWIQLPYCTPSPKSARVSMLTDA